MSLAHVHQNGFYIPFPVHSQLIGNCGLSNSGSPAGVGAATAQSAETHLATCQRSVPGVTAAADARHAAH